MRPTVALISHAASPTWMHRAGASGVIATTAESSP
jgi:hypothetical protein